MADAHHLSEEIDALLVQYLELLDQYTKLRAELSKLQSSVQQNIARANFTAERGLRYGQDHYDERMQATRLVVAAADELQVEMSARSDPAEEDKLDKEDREEGTEEKSTPAKPKDPIRMFGILVPQALRTAQSESINAVETIIPRLATVNKQMEALEIEIRRKRKHRAKAEAKLPTAKDVDPVVVESMG